MRAVLLATVIGISLAASAMTLEAADPVFVDLRIDQPDTVTVGDHVHYTVVIEVDAGTGVALAPSALPPEVALVAAPVTTRALVSEGREQVTISFDLAPFVAGEVLLPPLPLRYTLPDGSSGILESPASQIEVTSVLPAAGQLTPRDLKPQAEIGTAPPTWPLPVLAALIAGLVLLIISALVRRRVLQHRATRALQRAPVLVGPEDIARGALDSTGAAFAAERDFTRYYTSLGNTVRYYLSQRYGFPAFALTTRELEAEMVRLGLDRWQVRVASGLLTQCDAVVYAQYRPAAERADADLTAAYEIVEMSRPLDRAPVEQPEEEGVPVS